MMCTHAGVVSQAECPWCQIDQLKKRLSDAQAMYERDRDIARSACDELHGRLIEAENIAHVLSKQLSDAAAREAELQKELERTKDDCTQFTGDLHKRRQWHNADVERLKAERDQQAGEIERLNEWIDQLEHERDTLMGAVTFYREHADNMRKLKEGMEKIRFKLEGISNAWRNRTCMGQDISTILRVESTFGDIREAAEARGLLNELIDSFTPAEAPKEKPDAGLDSVERNFSPHLPDS